MDYNQENRLLSIETPLGPDVLAVIGLRGNEALSEGFCFHLNLYSENQAIVFNEIIGERVTIAIQLDNDETRFVNGIVSLFEQGSRPEGMADLPNINYYYAQVVPWCWLLTQTKNSRIFQEKNVKEIVEQVFADRGAVDFEWDLADADKYIKRTYCVQYHETDFNFVSRLLEEEGIYYYFRHEKKKHTMILADTTDKNIKCPSHETVKFHDGSSHMLNEDVIASLKKTIRITPTQYTLNDYHFIAPTTSLLVETKTNHQDNVGKGRREIYDYPGGYSEHMEGDHFGKIRMEEQEVNITTITGTGRCRGFYPGVLFTLENYQFRDDLNEKDYLLISVAQEARQSFEPAGIDQKSFYQNSFTCIPHEIPFRPARKSDRPFIPGAQTAFVVGQAGEEIYPDEYGRVKVQFHWDREGKKDENSSCWIRVRQSLSGAGWGGMFIPRIGQEVIVEFIEGDPDRPIITGCVYHGHNMPPYDLPAEKTKSTIKSNSSKGGGGANEFRFEDKKGAEEVYLHGQKDWNIAIENDKGQTVGHDETLTVGNNRTKSVGVDQSESVGSNKSITVGSNHSESVGANMTQNVGTNMSQTVGVNKAETIGAAKELTIGAAYQVTVGAAMNETIGAVKAEEIGAAKSVNVGANSSENIGGDKSVDAGKNISESAGKDVSITSGKKMSLSAGDDFSVSGKKKGVIEITDQLTIKVGKATITLKKNGDISLQGTKINIKGSGDITIKGSKILEN